MFRYADKTRNVRICFLVCLTFGVIGNVLYTISITPYFALAGRFLAGFVGALRAITTGEIARCYQGDEATSKITFVYLGYAVGFALGPLLSSMFLGVDFQVGVWRVNYTNAIGLFLAGIYLVSAVATVFGVSDLSKEFDLKEFAKRIDEVSTSDVEQSNCSDNKQDEQSLLIEKDSKKTKLENDNLPNIELSMNILLQKLLCSIDLSLVMCLTFFCSFATLAYDIWPTMIMIDMLGWTIIEVYILSAFIGFCTFILLIVLYKYPVSGQAAVYLALFALLMTAVMAILIIIICLRIENYWGNIALWCVYGLLFSIIDLVEEVFLCTVFTQMVPSSVQSFAESLRRLFTNIGGIFGILMSGSMFFAVLYICIGLIFNFLVCSFMLFIRRKKFMNPNYDAFL